MDDQETTATIQPPTLSPAISPDVHLGLTVVYTILYSVLFIIVYTQLWLILYYKHRRFSYQTVFLFLCLLWATLRITLFSFYYMNCATANNLNTFLYWLLYCCPVALQYITLCLLVIFFSGVYLRSLPPEFSNIYRCYLYAITVLCALSFLATNISCAVILKYYDHRSGSIPHYISLIRVSVSGTLFLVMSGLLCFCIYKMSKLADSTVVLEVKGMTVRQVSVACTLIILLYTSRVLYNFIAISEPLNKLLSFGFGWINVSDQADQENLDKGFAYVSFGIVLFVWEFLPTLIVVLFFRVHKPDEDSRALSRMSNESMNSRGYFYDSPQVDITDEDISRISRVGNDSILSAEGPYTINSVGSHRSYPSSLSPVRNFSTPNPDVRRPGGPFDDFYDGI